MKDIQKKIYKDISIEILDYLSNNEIKYNLQKEKKEIAKKVNQLLGKDKEEVEVIERFELRIISLLNWLEKIVEPMPRKVHFSKYLSKKIDEKRLNQDIINQINKFKEKFENGEDINSNLSKGIFDGNSWDYILNIWNIRHLHLSESVKFDKRAMSGNRSEYLLFFVLYKSDVYFIDVRKHPKGSGFTSFEFLEILSESDWLEIIGLKELEGVKDVNPVIEQDDDIYQLTKSGINIAYKINDKFYINFGGITSIGSKSQHTDWLISLRKKINEFSEKNEIEYIKFKLLLDGKLGVIKYKINSEEKELSLP